MFKTSIQRKCPALTAKLGRRLLHAKLDVSPEVAQAIQEKKPVVSLESTIITHGLPYPSNIEMATIAEDVIRSRGAVPATVGFIQGVPKVGLSSKEIAFLAENSHTAEKVSRRDIPIVMTRKLNGGTTIAGTMILSHLAGIKVFGTGGLGGVHRGAETTMDISTDLDELARTPVAVVCSGPKSILDIPKTMEYLETKGVPVITYGQPGVHVPGFFTRESGVISPFNFTSIQEAASYIHASECLSLNSGQVFCIPVPEEHSLPKEFMDNIIDQAVEDCMEAGIEGKAITPFLLDRIRERTKHDSVATNVEFVKLNADYAAQIAVALAKLEIPGPNLKVYSVPRPEVGGHPIIRQEDGGHSAPAVDIAVVGAVAKDITCTLVEGAKGKDLLGTSHHSRTHTSIGGVGHNIALAAARYRKDLSVQLISQVGEEDKDIVRQLEHEGLNTNGMLQVGSVHETAKYTAVHDKDGDLVVAGADMEIVENIDISHIKEKISQWTPKWVMVDGNVGTTQLNETIKFSKSVGALVGFEPTSGPKATQLAALDLSLYPNHSIDIATPNLIELEAAYLSFMSAGKFGADSDWFAILDTLQINEEFRAKAARIVPPEMVKAGTLTQALSLLPFIPNLYLTCGAQGVTTFQIASLNSHLPRDACLSSGRHGIGALVQHYPAIESPGKVVSVTGAGDTFCGVLLAELTKNPHLITDYGSAKSQAIANAQRAACLAIQSPLAVPSSFS